jgi:predicted ATP-dependent endonuclease of OLD family
MRLKSLNVKNYRGLKGDRNIIDFDKSEIIFLIGENNTGKSTFLNAYSFFTNPKPKAEKKDFYNNDFSIPIEIEAQFTVVPEEDIKDKSLSKDDPDWIKKWTDKEHIIKIKKVWVDDKESGKKHTFNPSTNTYQEGGFGGFDTLLTKYAPQVIIINAVVTVSDLETGINEIIAKNHIKKLETSYADSYANIKNEFEKLKDDISKSDDINEVNNRMNVFFNEIFPRLALSIYPLPDEGVDLSKSLKSTHGISVHDEESDLTDMDLKQNGHGIIRQAFFSFLSTYQKNIEGKEKQYLILYEEPELYLHPEAVFSLRSQLYKLAENSPYQILCATHSPLMIDLEKSHASLVRLVKMQDNTTMTYQVHFDLFDSEDKNHLQMINRFNPHVCETFFARRIVLVEGDTEAVFYREIIRRYYPDKKAYILNTGSKANMVFYQKILTHFGIFHVVVHDSDTPTYKNEAGNEKPNPMFSYNEAIWKQLEESNKIIPNLARRFVHIKDFESAHDYKINMVEGKPLSAYNFALSISKNNNFPCFRFLDDLFGENKINVTQEELRERVDAL